MPTTSVVKANLYKDSVALMRISQLVAERTGVRRATLMMGTSGNKDILAQARLLSPEVEHAGPTDIMVVIEDDSSKAVTAALREVDALIEGEETRKGSRHVEEAAPKSIAMSVAMKSGANLALISVPGPYAAAEALKALHCGLNVFLFSDNVAIEQERILKELAQRKNLLVMGPDCGTAIIQGVPLGFANVVRRGNIGLIGASGTGLQEISCRIHHMGAGLSHAIGTGSHDVLQEIGAVTMRQALTLLAEDQGTQTIVIVSKPPAKSIQEVIIRESNSIGKPVVVCFLGSEFDVKNLAPSVHRASTLLEAAEIAVALERGVPVPHRDELPDLHFSSQSERLTSNQRWIRGLYSGGTFCFEAQVVWQRYGINAYSNAPLAETFRLTDGRISQEHSAIDLGSDEFTIGRPHPMIDYGTRTQRILEEARDPTVAVILLDVVLGYGSHDNPAGALRPAVDEAKAIAARAGRHLSIVGFLCGTEDDPQRLSMQQSTLQDAGVTLAPSSTMAAHLAAAIALRGKTAKGAATTLSQASAQQAV